MLLTKHHEEYSVCSRISWYIRLSLLMYGNFLVTMIVHSCTVSFLLKKVWSFLSHTTLQYPNLDYMWIFQFLPWKPSNFYMFPKHIFTLPLVMYLQYYLWKYETFNLFYITLNIHFFKHLNENVDYQIKTSVKLHLNFTISHQWWHSVIMNHLSGGCI